MIDSEPAAASPTSPTPLISARHLRRGYGSTPVLSDVSFDIGPGVTGLLGANGTGKTTILGLIIGLHPCDSGELRVLGLDPWRAGAGVRERLGYAPEHHTLPPDIRAAEFVTHVAELHGLPTNEARTRASDALWLVGLGEERFRAMGTMSTGQRQRVKLAQAIAHDPDLVLLDEPTDGLDPMQRDAMLELIRNVSTQFGIHVVLSSHLLDEVDRICDGVVIIGDGVTLAHGSLPELRGHAGAAVIAEPDADLDRMADLAAAMERRARPAGSVRAMVDGRAIRLETAGPEGGEVEGVPVDDLLGRLGDVVRDVLADADVGLVRLQPRRRSLEDVFLATTGHPSREL